MQALTGHKVINAGIPGEVSKAGLRRLPSVLQAVQPNLVILCHGGNDLIRNMGRAQLKENLEQMISLIKDTGARVILIGVPSFNIMLDVPSLYEELAQQHEIPVELESLYD
ncbi:MAG: hypothetical protein A6F71_09500 [Cycloclasticus sp. symbiont of Poecilosclerida sp. M]|nr:MAG: hypothetical protein A6F71_09500 [Cycloclasticus sp. symbiont of Poecilosclerida sp. M]